MKFLERVDTVLIILKRTEPKANTWGHFCKTKYSDYGLSRAPGYHLELN